MLIIKWKILKELSITSSLQGRCNLYINGKISIVKYKVTINLLKDKKRIYR